MFVCFFFSEIRCLFSSNKMEADHRADHAGQELGYFHASPLEAFGFGAEFCAPFAALEAASPITPNCRSVQITLNSSSANAGETLYVHVPRFSENELLVPGSPALRLDIDLSGGHVTNYLAQTFHGRLSRSWSSNLVTEIQNTPDFDVFKLFQDLFLSKDERENMFLEGIQSESLNKIRSNTCDKATSGVATETKLNTVYDSKYRIRLDNQILADQCIFYHARSTTTRFSS